MVTFARLPTPLFTSTIPLGEPVCVIVAQVAELFKVTVPAKRLQLRVVIAVDALPLRSRKLGELEPPDTRKFQQRAVEVKVGS
jgi:hypothetical protein